MKRKNRPHVSAVHPLIKKCFIVYNKVKSISLRGGIMSIRKEDLHFRGVTVTKSKI